MFYFLFFGGSETNKSLAESDEKCVSRKKVARASKVANLCRASRMAIRVRRSVQHAQSTTVF